MNYLFLIPISLCLGAVGLGAFLWSLHTNQYEDLEGAAVRILPPETAPGSTGDNPKNQNSAG